MPVLDGPRGQSSAGGGGNQNGTIYVNPFANAQANGGRVDEGVDYSGSGSIGAVGRCLVTYSNPNDGWYPPAPAYLIYKLLDGPLAGFFIYVSEYIGNLAPVGSTIPAGGHVCSFSGSSSFTGGGIEMGWNSTSNSGLPLAKTTGGYSESQQTAAGQDFADFMNKLGAPHDTGPTIPGIVGNLNQMPFHTHGQSITGSGTGGGGGTGGIGSGSDASTRAKATAFATFLNIPGILDYTESQLLTGERSLLNDQPILPFVEQLTQASLRNFQSMPNGNFFAFYPDYFGGLNHRTPYWEIADIEIIDGQIQLSDDLLATHVYVVGDTVGMDGVTIIDKIDTAGVVTVFNAFMADFLNGDNAPLLASKEKNKKKLKKDQAAYERELLEKPTLAERHKAIAFLKKYGARPLYQEMPMVRSHFYELFLAYQVFCLFWSKQFLTRFEFTFMPELYPGGIVSFPDHGIQCYIDEVTHNCSYTDGFTTQANLSAPAALKDGHGKPVRADRAWVNQGMVRAGIFGPAGPKGS